MLTLQEHDQKQTRVLLPALEPSPHWQDPTDWRSPTNLHIKDKRMRESRLSQTPQAPRLILTPTKAWEIHHYPCMEDPEWPDPKWPRFVLHVSDSKRLGIKVNYIPARALPKNCKDSAKTLYDSSFAVTCRRLWDAIPKSVKCHTKKEGFKNTLNMFLRKRVRNHPLAPGPTARLFRIRNRPHSPQQLNVRLESNQSGRLL